MKVESTFSSIGTEPITLSEAKAHLRVSNTQEDTMITRMITSAREWAERYCNRAFIDKTVTQYVSEPGDTTEFDLIHVPVATITSVKRIDKEGTATTLTLNTNYWKIGTPSRPFVLLKYSAPTIPIPTSLFTLPARVVQDQFRRLS